MRNRSTGVHPARARQYCSLRPKTMSFTRSMRVPATKFGNGSLGKPVARSSLPCGNIDPLGVTGTPVIDESTKAIYLNAAVDGPSGPRHLVFALSLKDGSLLPGWPVDVGDALEGEQKNFMPATRTSVVPWRYSGARFMCLSAVISAIAASITASSWVFLFPSRGQSGAGRHAGAVAASGRRVGSARTESRYS